MDFYHGISCDVQQLIHLVSAPMYSKICMTAIEMDIFTFLAQPQSASVLAEKQNWHIGNTELFLDAVTSLGILAKEQGVYCNMPVADKHLVRGKPDFIGDYVVEFYRASRYDDADLADMVRNGPEHQTPVTMTNVSFTEMAEMMRRMQAGGRSTEGVDILCSLPEYKDAEKILDLGCGTGMIGIAAVQAHPTMTGILYDVPAMGEAVWESIRLQNAKDRVQFMAGNYLTDDIGAGYDIVLAVGTLNFAKPNLVPLMKKIHNALNEGGIVVCISDGVYDEGTKPKEILAGWLVSGLQGMDYRMPRGLIADAAQKAGFRSIQSHVDVATYMGTMDIDILHK